MVENQEVIKPAVRDLVRVMKSEAELALLKTEEEEDEMKWLPSEDTKGIQENSCEQDNREETSVSDLESIAAIFKEKSQYIEDSGLCTEHSNVRHKDDETRSNVEYTTSREFNMLKNSKPLVNPDSRSNIQFNVIGDCASEYITSDLIDSNPSYSSSAKTESRDKIVDSQPLEMTNDKNTEEVVDLISDSISGSKSEAVLQKKSFLKVTKEFSNFSQLTQISGNLGHLSEDVGLDTLKSNPLNVNDTSKVKHDFKSAVGKRKRTHNVAYPKTEAPLDSDESLTEIACSPQPDTYDSCSDWEQEYLASKHDCSKSKTITKDQAKPDEEANTTYSCLNSFNTLNESNMEFKNDMPSNMNVASCKTNLYVETNLLEHLNNSLCGGLNMDCNRLPNNYKNDRKIDLKAKSHLENETNSKSSSDQLLNQNQQIIEHQYDWKDLPPESFVCPVCQKIFQTSSTFNNHKRTLCFGKTRALKYQCDICGKLFNGSNKLECHKITHTKAKPYKCVDCDKCFGSVCLRNTHHDTVHTNISRDKKFLCCFCGITTPSFEHIRAHEDSHLVPEGALVTASFKCLQCEKGFISNFKFKRHLRKHLPYRCKQCNATYATSELLEKHQISHKCNEEFKCGICDKVFKQKASVYQHQRYAHVYNAPFFCDICDKGFKQKHHIQQHMITHSDERPISCDMCEETFKRKTHLKQHVAAFHNKSKRR